MHIEQSFTFAEAIDRYRGRVKRRKIQTSGKKGFECSRLIEEAMQLSYDIEQQQGWVNAKKEQLRSYITNNGKHLQSEEITRNIFYEGIGNIIIQEYRGRKQERDQVPLSMEELHGVLFAYFVDFYQLISCCQRLDISQENALKIIKKTYHYGSTTLSRVFAKDEACRWRDFSDSALLYAITHNPRNPEGFLTKAADTLSDLLEKQKEKDCPWRDFPKSTIVHAVTHNPRNPEGFLTKAADTLSDLLERQEEEDCPWRDFSYSVLIEAAIRRPRNPKGFLIKAADTLSDLLERQEEEDCPWRDFLKYVLIRVVTNNPDNPESFLTKAADTLSDLLERQKEKDCQWKNFPKYVLIRAVIYYSNNVESFLIKMRKLMDDSRFSTISFSEIYQAAHRKNSEEYLKKVRVKKLKNKKICNDLCLLLYGKTVVNPEDTYIVSDIYRDGFDPFINWLQEGVMFFSKYFNFIERDEIMNIMCQTLVTTIQEEPDIAITDLMALIVISVERSLSKEKGKYYRKSLSETIKRNKKGTLADMRKSDVNLEEEIIEKKILISALDRLSTFEKYIATKLLGVETSQLGISELVDEINFSLDWKEYGEQTEESLFFILDKIISKIKEQKK